MDHKGHLFGGDGLGGDDEVGFIFAVWFIEDYYELAIAWRKRRRVSSEPLTEKGVGPYGKPGWCLVSSQTQTCRELLRS